MPQRILAVLFLWIVLVLPRSANANPEPSLYDARAVALAGLGVAFLESPAAIFHNPANLQGVEDVAATAAFTLIVADLQGPISGPEDMRHTGASYGPALLLAAAKRVDERFVIGLGGYVSTAFGASYEAVERINETDLFYPEDQTVYFFAGELALPVSYRVHENLQLGIAARLPYGRQYAQMTQEIFEGTYRPIEQSVSGFGSPGVLLGVTYRPMENLTLAASYRSKTAIDMDGTTSISFTQADPLQVATATTWYTPHRFRVGSAAWCMRNRLMLTGEFRAQFHESANESQTFTQELNGFEEIVVPLHWNNVYGVGMAAEYWTKWGTPLRGGTSFSNSATSRSAIQFFTPPSGLLHALFVGTGIRRTHYELDVALSVQWGSDTVPEQAHLCQPGDQIKVGCPGAYGVLSSFLSISISDRR